LKKGWILLNEHLMGQTIPDIDGRRTEVVNDVHLLFSKGRTILVQWTFPSTALIVLKFTRVFSSSHKQDSATASPAAANGATLLPTVETKP
jgi:hypothetical protein